MKVKDFAKNYEILIQICKQKKNISSEEIMDMKENLRRIRLNPPVVLEREMSKKDEKKAKKLFKTLGVEVIEIK